MDPVYIYNLTIGTVSILDVCIDAVLQSIYTGVKSAPDTPTRMQKKNLVTEMVRD